MTCPDCARAEAQAAQAELYAHAARVELEHRDRVIASLKQKLEQYEAAEKKKGRR